MDDRTRALEDIVTLVTRHHLTLNEIAAALGTPQHRTAESRWRGILVHALGILGGTFVFAGVGVFIALQWDALNSAARLVVTLGSGVTAFALAVLSTRDSRFDKATTPLFLMATALQPTGMLVAFDEFGSGGDWRVATLVTAGVMALQFGLTFFVIRRSTLLLLSITFAAMFWTVAFDLIDLDETLAAIIVGASLLLTAIGVDRRGYRDITPVVYLVGGISFLYGFFDSVEDTFVEISFLAVASGFVYLSAMLRSRTLLVVATLAILAYTGYFTGEHFADSVGWPIALIAFGIFMIGLSALALRIDRDYVRASASTGDRRD